MYAKTFLSANSRATVSSNAYGRGAPPCGYPVVRRGLPPLPGGTRDSLRLEQLPLFREQASRVVARSARHVALLWRGGGVSQGQRGGWSCPEQSQQGFRPDDVLRQDLLHQRHEVGSEDYPVGSRFGITPFLALSRLLLTPLGPMCSIRTRKRRAQS